MLNQKEAVSEVLSLYEEMESLKQANEELLRAKDKRLCEKENGKKTDPLTEKFARYGRERFMDDCVNTWSDITAYRSEGEGMWFSPNSFEKWADKKLNRREIPSYMCRDDAMNALHEELFGLYQKEKKEAIELLLEKEAEAKAVRDVRGVTPKSSETTAKRGAKHGA